MLNSGWQWSMVVPVVFLTISLSLVLSVALFGYRRLVVADVSSLVEVGFNGEQFSMIIVIILFKWFIFYLYKMLWFIGSLNGLMMFSVQYNYIL